MQIFITGSTGFIGRHITNLLVSRGHRIRALVRSSPRDLPPEIEAVIGDLSTMPAAALAGVDAVLHLAASGVSKRDRSWLDCQRTNIDGTILLLRTLTEVNPQARLLHSSTFYESFIHQCPGILTDAYVMTKRLSSEAVRAFREASNGATGLLYFHHVYGEGDTHANLVNYTIECCKHLIPMQFGCGASLRDWIHVKDAARAVVQAVEQLPSSGFHTYDIGSGKSLTIRALVELIAHYADCPGDLLEFSDAFGRGDASIQSVAQRLPPGFAPSIPIDTGIRTLLQSLNRS